MAFMSSNSRFSDFQRFLYGKSWQNSDFFEQTVPEIHWRLRLFYSFSYTVMHQHENLEKQDKVKIIKWECIVNLCWKVPLRIVRMGGHTWWWLLLPPDVKREQPDEVIITIIIKPFACGTRKRRVEDKWSTTGPKPSMDTNIIVTLMFPHWKRWCCPEFGLKAT